MGELYESIDDRLTQWILAQPVFFVATATSSESGSVNCSPKGLMDSFRIIDNLTVAYVDYVGSGIETASHLRENGRIVIMFCAFQGPPKILRLHGRGEYLDWNSDGFADLIQHFPDSAGARGIIKVSVSRISDSCGFGVPRMTFIEERDTLPKWVEQQGEAGLIDYVHKNNALSIDDLPGI